MVTEHVTGRRSLRRHNRGTALALRGSSKRDAEGSDGCDGRVTIKTKALRELLSPCVLLCAGTRRTDPFDQVEEAWAELPHEIGVRKVRRKKAIGEVVE